MLNLENMMKVSAYLTVKGNVFKKIRKEQVISKKSYTFIAKSSSLIIL